MIYAFVIWILFAATWFFVIPEEARGKKWSYAHMAVPGITLAIWRLVTGASNTPPPTIVQPGW